MSESTEMIQAETGAAIAAPAKKMGINVWNDKDAFDQMSRVAAVLSKSQIIPQQYQGKPEDCFIAVEMASRMGASPLFIMQNLYVVKGKPSWAGQACMAMIQSCGKFKNVKHVYTGTKGSDSRGCFVTAVRISDGETIEGTEVTMAMAKSEGWLTNSKWKNMPEQMLGYRAASFFARMYCPEAMMGLQTVEEVYDVNGGNDEPEVLYFCDDCGTQIRGAKGFPAAKIAEMGTKKYGRCLCLDCAKKAKEEAEKAKELAADAAGKGEQE